MDSRKKDEKNNEPHNKQTENINCRQIKNNVISDPLNSTYKQISKEETEIKNQNYKKDEEKPKINELQQVSKDFKEMNDKELITHYKTLFLKSKKVIKNYEDELKQLQAINLGLKEKLKEYESEEGVTCEVVFRFKYNDSKFMFFKSENKNYFINEHILDEKFKLEINQNENIKLYDYYNDILSKEETINQIITQYDDKMKRLSRELENTEKRIKDLKDADKHLKDELKDLKNNSENELRKYDQSIKEIIESTSETITQMKNTMEIDLSDETLGEELLERIKERINKINPSNDIECFRWLNELKLYISKTLLTFLEIIHKYVNLENNLSTQKIKWQQTLDQLVLSHEEELNTNFRNIENLKLQIQSLNNKIGVLEQDKYNIAKQKDQTIEILNKELNRGVNINYLRNVLISFLTSNKESIKEGLLPVIFTTLQFSETEIKRVNESMQKKSDSGGIFNLFKN